jgi:peptide/nickel transport system ATP-binding protein
MVRLTDLHTHFDLNAGFLTSLFGGRPSVVRAVDGVNLEVAEGEVFGIVGESGSGKTSLGRTILRLLEPTSGRVEVAGRDITDLRERHLRPLRREMQLVFQDPHAALNPAMTIAEAVAHPLKVHHLADDDRDARRQAAEMLERVGVSPASAFLDRYPDDLSGGQKQRVVIARALITRPKLVVADEPVAMLDMSVRAKILELMLELKDDLGLTYVFITHDLATAKFLCDRIAIMYLGQIVETGRSAEVYAEPRHPYTRALLEAVPDPTRRDRTRSLPSGEIPDAVDPPHGCRFHPRCPSHFDVCGWEGRDLVDWLEERWTDPEALSQEAAIVGSIDAIRVTPKSATFPSGGDGLAAQLETWRSEAVHPIFTAVTAIERSGSSVIVRFGFGPAPELQAVGGCEVSCHLYGVTGVDPDAPVEDQLKGVTPSST